MRYAWQYFRSLVFIIQMYLMMAILSIFFMPYALISRRGAYEGCRTYCRWVRWTAGWMIGLKTEVRGTPPVGEAIIAAKHQSFLDILLIVSVIHEPKFIMKAELKYAPFLGWFGTRIGNIAVDRKRKAGAVIQMVNQVKDPNAPKGQLIIYPQGTRVAPGVDKPYKAGVGALYAALGQPCYPAGTNVGVFWPRHGIYRAPGLAVVEFLPVIEAGLGISEFMERVESVVEESSDRLMAEAGFKA
ncbi:MAG: 1-acyl-sn-glycerol-3-phosphate acyltransferase [Dinoroseobacter sp.]|jgi:1-acyl-sn-glycerol-3-phosphate acyltransferase